MYRLPDMSTERVIYDIPQSLREWRDDKQMTTEQAAKRLGISQGYYSHLENGTRCPSGTMAKRLHHKTQVPIPALVGEA